MRRQQIALMITLSTLSSLGMGLLSSIYPIFVLNRFSASVLDVGMLAAVFAYLFAFDIAHLYLIEFFFGVSYALQGPSRLALIMEVSNNRGEKGLTLGIFESAYDIAGSIAALIAAVIVSRLGFELLFFLCSGCHIATGILILKIDKIDLDKPLINPR